MINNNKLDNILNFNKFPAVSIFIPTLITGDYEVNRIRWKNELSKVYEKLDAQGYNKKSFLKPAHDLIDNADFWANQSSGLAGYFSEDFSKIVHLHSSPTAQNFLSNTFVTTPILLTKMNKQRVFLLTISQKNIRFFEAVPTGIFPVKIDDLVPENMEEALYLDIQKETLHPTGQGLTNTNHFKDKTNIRLEQYFRKIDEGIWTLLEGEKVPLVIGAVEEYQSTYRRISNYKYISQHMLTGNTDNMTPAELRSQLQPVFDDLYKKEHEKVSEIINEDYENKKLVTSKEDLQFNFEIGNVSTLIIPTNYFEKDDERVLGIEKMIRECYNKNIQVSIRDDFDKLSALTHQVIESQVQ
ncbi:MAG: hypothetical protein HKO66_10340 [Saprospiraceae bacterium]|nr:hypothetical protein [Bacteroidia bacterium]NNE14578.1 hypothetical protein [Saprospiraceae bacterium]NNL92621.1 hypothetical protein [Saprospiraceae bacterium]